MLYRIALTIVLIVVFAIVLFSKDDAGTSASPAFQAPPSNEPAMKGLQIN